MEGAGRQSLPAMPSQPSDSQHAGSSQPVTGVGRGSEGLLGTIDVLDTQDQHRRRTTGTEIQFTDGFLRYPAQA